MTVFVKIVTLFVFVLILSTPIEAKSLSTAALLGEHYDDGSEMAQRILNEFLGSKECNNECERMEERELLNSFENFRSAWVTRMVDVVIT